MYICSTIRNKDYITFKKITDMKNFKLNPAVTEADFRVKLAMGTFVDDCKYWEYSDVVSSIRNENVRKNNETQIEIEANAAMHQEYMREDGFSDAEIAEKIEEIKTEKIEEMLETDYEKIEEQFLSDTTITIQIQTGTEGLSTVYWYNEGGSAETGDDKATINDIIKMLNNGTINLSDCDDCSIDENDNYCSLFVEYEL